MISNELLKKKILDQAFSGNLIKSSFDNVCYKEISLVMKNYDSIRKPVSKTIRNNLNNRYNYYGATGKIDMIDNYIFDGNYLLIGEDGGNFYVDKDNCYVVNGKFWANNHVHVLSANNAVTNNYIKHYLNSLNFVKMGLITGTAIPKLNQKNLNSIKVPMISLNNQAKIVKKIEELFELIDKKEKNDKEKDQLKTLLKEKILDSAIHGQLVENDLSLPIVDVEEIKEGVPFDIPSNWKWSNLKNNCEKMYAGGDKPLKFSKEMTDELSIPVVANGVTNDGIIGYTDFPTETDKCLTISGRGTIGYTSIRNYPFTPIVRLITIKPKDYLNINYLKYVMNYATESSKGTSIPQLTIPMIKNKLIPIPPLEQQKKIVEKIEKCFKLIEQL